MKAMRSFALAVAVLGSVVPTLAVCANVLRITPDPALAGITPLPVKGRSPTAWDKRIRFGEWQARSVTKFEMHEQSVGAGAETSRARKDIALREIVARFDLEVAREGSDVTRVHCDTRTASGDHAKSWGRRSNETSLTLPGYPRIDCTFGGARPGLLAVQAAPVTLFETGHADLPGARWQIRSVGKVVRLGYELLLNEQVVAAVETASVGRVWISATLDAARQEELAVLASSLLYSTAALELQDP